MRKKLAESYYGKTFNKLRNILVNDELDWVENVGDETW